MSRKIKRPFDADENDKTFVPGLVPEFMEGVPKVDHGDPVYREGSEFDLLVSRARYIGLNKAKHHKQRLSLLVISDEMEAFADPVDALGMMDELYRGEARRFSEFLHLDEEIKLPSDDARARARLLAVYLKRFQEYNDIKSPIFRDLFTILSVWATPGNEKHAFAQRLVKDNPTWSKARIAKESEAYPDRAFDQSCLTQWIAAGIVIDAHSDQRPKWSLGQG